MLPVLNITPAEHNEPAFKTLKINYAIIILGICCLIGFITFAIRGSFGLFFTSIESEFNLSRTTTSLIQSVCQLVSCSIALYGGWLQDRFGARRALILAAILTGAGLLVISQAKALWQVYAGYSFLVAIGTGSVNAILMAVVARWFVNQRAFALGIVTSSISLSAMVAPLTAYLISGYGWQNTYLIMAITVLALWLPGAFLLKSSSNQAKRTSVVKQSQPVKQDGLNFQQTLKSRYFWLFCTLAVLHAVSMLIVGTHIIPHALDVGLKVEQASIIMVVSGGAGLIARLVVGRLTTESNKKLIIILSTIFMAIAIFWLIFADDLWMFLVYAVVWGFSMGSIDPPLMSLVPDIFGTYRLGAVFGAMDAAFGVGAAVGPAIAGFIFDVSGEYTAAFLLGAALMAATVLLVLPLRSEKKSGPAY
mgnify:CR=1 FL=1